MSDWIRRSYSGIGLTQSPPGKYLAVLQEPYVGKVILCIDISGSMGTHEAGKTRLQHAVAGAEIFVKEAVNNHYKVGLVLWDTDVRHFSPLNAEAKPVIQALHNASIGGGTSVNPALRLGIQQLGHLAGDRVIAIFGDGDIGAIAPAVASSRAASALGIRIIVRGLGEYAAAQLNLIATETAGPGSEEQVVQGAEGIEQGIASMAYGLRAGGIGGFGR